jgi:metallo-beta-lactamase class B
MPAASALQSERGGRRRQPAGRKRAQARENTTDDPQFGFGHDSNEFPRANNVRVVKDGEVLRVGTLAISAPYAWTHPGSTTWTWKSCEDARCLDVLTDSLNAVSAPGSNTRTIPARRRLQEKASQRSRRCRAMS